MEAKVTSYIFRRMGHEFVVPSADRTKLLRFSEEMMDCMKRQYKMQGFMILVDCEAGVIVSKVDNEVELFLEQLRK